MIIIQCAGMKYQFGNFTISYIDSVTYYGYIGSKAMCIKNGKEYSQLGNPRADYQFSQEATEQKRLASTDFKYQLQHNTLNLIKAYISDVRENTVSGNSCIDECNNLKSRSGFDFWKELFSDLSKWQNRFYTLLAIVLAMFFLLKTYKKPDLLTFVSFFIMYIIVLSGISCGQGDRFHLVTFPFMFLLLAKYLSNMNYFKQSSEPLQK
jgi:hypothetical protein